VGIHEKLAKRVYRECGFLPTWPVVDRVEVGEVVTRTEGGLHHETTLRDLLPGESFDLYEGAVPEGQDVVRVLHGVKGDFGAGVAAAFARLTFRFEQSFSYLFVVRGGTLHRFKRLHGVRQTVLDLRAAGVWQKDWQLITSVRSADYYTVLTADEPGLVAEARARVSTPLGVGDVDLAALDISSKVAWTPMSGLDYVASHATPLHQALRVRRILRPKTVHATRVQGVHEDSEYGVDVVDPESMFDSEDATTDLANDSGEAGL
jgi:hypothetical protein